MIAYGQEEAADALISQVGGICDKGEGAVPIRWCGVEEKHGSGPARGGAFPVLRSLRRVKGVWVCGAAVLFARLVAR
jgi:hypothetical protein